VNSKYLKGAIMADRNTFQVWNELGSLVDVAYGLACLADYECYDSLCIAEEREAAQHAPMHAARLLLKRAKVLVDQLEACHRGD
jgi:hypothetical protein